MARTTRAVRVLASAAVLTSSALLVAPATAGAVSDPSSTVFINELHYDNNGGDVGEFFEVAGPAGTDLTGWSVVLYNGSNGTSYNTIALGDTLADQSGGYGFSATTLPANGLQNGAPDGLALVDPASNVVEFLSYEGTFTATDGPANGLLSTDIGVSEVGSTPIGESLQRTGTGDNAGAFTFAGPSAETPGAVNTGQTFEGGPSAPTPPVINELGVSDAGADNEFAEFLGDPNADYSAYTLLEVEGDSAYGVINNVVALGTADADGRVTVDPAPAFQNGSTTFLLVEGFTGAAGDDLDTDDDGTPDVTPWTAIADSVSIDDGGTGDIHYGTPVLDESFDDARLDNDFAPGGLSRIPDGTDTDTAADWYRNDFSWDGAANGSPEPGEALNTPGAANEIVAPVAPTVFISEIHYDNAGGDVGEFVEVEGDAGTDLSGWSLVAYNGNGGGAYNTVALSGTIDDEAGGQGAVSFAISGLQNGSPDGVALVDPGGNVVEFLSYEGSFAATDGPANGQTSTDIGVSEPGSTPIGESLQLIDGTWTGPAAESPGVLNGGGSSPGLAFPFTENFDTDCVANGFQIISVDADTANTWTCSTQFSNADVNGFGDSAPADEWLITPALDMDAQTDEVLNFRNFTNFSDIAYPQLEVVYSSDYDGADPTTATWTPLTGINFSPEDSGQFVDSGPIDLSGISGNAVYFAFHYTSSGTGGGSAATWRIDEVEFTAGGGGGDPEPKFIHEIQGAGDASPLDGQPVIISGIVVGDYQEIVTADPSDEPLEGFFVQEEDGDADTDPNTSEGIFVFYPANTVAVSVGDLVEVTGTVDEFFGLTEIVNVTDVTVVSSGNPAPTPAAPTLPTAVGDPTVNWEAIEGMSVSFSQPLYVTGLFPLGSFGEIQLSAIGAQDHPNQIHPVGSQAAIDQRQLNQDARVILEDGEDENESFPSGIPTWNPTPTPFLDGPEGTIRSGDEVANLSGVVNYAFGEFEVIPVNVSDPTDPDGAVTINRTPRPVGVPDVGGDLTVAAFNVLNYFVTIDTGGATCGPNASGCRGADTQAEFDVQSAKIADAIADLDADIVGLIEIENSPNDEAVADLVARVNALSSRTYDYVPTGFIGGDAIVVAFIYDTSTVGLDGAFAVLDSSVSPAFIDTDNRPALAQTFVDLSSNNSVTVAVNHLKSKGSPCDDVANPGDPAFGVAPYAAGDDIDVGTNGDPDYTGNCNLTRTAAAQVLGGWMAADPTGTGADKTLIIGDLNAYANETPITALEALGYTDLNEAFNGNSFATGGHSYVFNGELGTLDYALSNPALTPFVTGAAAWHINADEPFAIDYQNFNPPGQATLDEWKSSDHDPVIVGLSLETVYECAGVSGTLAQLEAAGYNVIIGDDGNNFIVGTNGPDFILGEGGRDNIYSLRGDDVVCGGDGNDGIWTNNGDDRVDAGDGNDIVFAGRDDDTVYGGEGDDGIWTQNGDDTVDAGAGKDNVFAGGGADTVSGGDGNDSLYGGGGADQLNGDADDDTLVGNGGRDVCDGGSGTDTAARSCETKIDIP